MRTRRLQVITAVFLALAPAWAGLAATGGTVTDGDVTLVVPATHWDAGLAYGLVDFRGTEPSPTADVLSRLAFWYRVEGLDSRELRLPPPSVELYTDAATFRWTNLDGRSLDLDIVIRPGNSEAPSGWLSIIASMRNTGTQARQVSLFCYLDVDGGGTPGDDVGELRGNAQLALHDSPSAPPVRILPLAGLWWSVRGVNAADNLLDQLDDNLPTTLDRTGLPQNLPTNLAAAFQGTVNVQPNGPAPIALWISLSNRAPADVVKGDWDGNGTPDLVFQYPATNQEYTWFMRRTGRWQMYVRSTGGRSMRGVDRFDATRSYSQRVDQDAAGQVYIDTTPLQGAPVLASNWQIAATGDFSGDGLGDILWRNTTSQKLVIWTVSGVAKTGNIIPSPDQAVDGNWEVVGAADFTGDGVRDLLWYNGSSGNLVIWAMNAAVARINGFFTSPASAGGANWRPVAVGDFGRGGAPAGTPDIVWRNSTSGRLVVWHLDYAGQRTSGVFTNPDLPTDPLNAVVTGPR